MFKAFKEEIENSDIVDIISQRVVKLFETQETVIQVPHSEDTKETRNICHQPFPLEYYLDVSDNIRRENFYKSVKYGDILHSKILSYRSSGHYFVNIFAAVGIGKTRNLIDCDVVAHMKSDDTDPDVKDSDVYGNWKIKTHLIVEVLDVKNLGGNPRLHVGTKGTTLDIYQRKKDLLGNVTEPFPITETSWDERNPSYSKALLRCKTFNRAKSTKILCQHFNLNFRMHSSSANNNIRMQNLDSSQPDTDNDPDIEVIYASSDSEDIQVTKVELSSKQKADNLIREAISNYRECNYENALEKLESVFAIDPSNTMAIVALGVNTYRLGDSDGACQLLTRALELDPDNIDAIIAKASILSNNGELDEALELLDPAIKQDTMRIKAKYNKAKSYYSKIAEEKALDCINNGNKQEAIQFYRKALHVDPQNIEVEKALSHLRKKGDSVELICLSSDEDDENIMDTCPTEILRSQVSREQEYLSDDDPEDDDGHMDNSYNLRVKEFLQNFPRLEETNLSQNQNIIDTDANENGSERGTSERESDICEQDCRVFNNDIPETNENEAERGTSERESDICEQDCRVFNKDNITESHEFENTKRNESIDTYDDKLERTVLMESNDCEELNISEIEKPLTTLSEELKECELTKSCKSKNSQTNVDSLEEVSTNNKVTDSKENENTMKKLPKKRTLPKLKRLPVGYRVENNSLRTMRPQDNQGITKQEECSKKNQSVENNSLHMMSPQDNQGCTKQDEFGKKKQSPLKMSNEKEMSNRLIGSNLSNNNIKENKAQYSGNNNDNFELANVDRTVPDREQSYKKKKVLNKTKESKSEDNENAQYFKNLSRKDFYKNRENNKKNKYEEAVINKSSSTEKHKNSHSNKEEINEKSKNKNPSDKLEKRSSRSSKDSYKKNTDSNKCIKQMLENDSDIHAKKVKQLHSKEKLTDKSKKVIKNNHQRTKDYLKTSTNDEENIFEVDRNSINTMKLDDFDLPDIETSVPSNHSEHYDPQNSEDDEDYDELNELRKDLEQASNREDIINKKTPENKNKLSNTLLQSIRKENEKTEKMKYQSEISNRSTRDIKHNTAKESPVKQNDGKRRAILLADPIVPPSEIRKRRRRKNDVRHEDEEETPKKKYSKRKSQNSESQSEAIAGPSTPQKTPILSMPIKDSSVDVQTPTRNSVEVQTPTLNSSPNQKESIATGPREISKRKLGEALCNRHEAVRREFKHIDENYINDLAESIEEELYNLFSGDTGKSYKTKFRSLYHNIKDPKNETLFRGILNCEVSPKMLVKMDQNELASEELSSLREMRNKKVLDAIVHTARENVECSKNQYILKNHKGELEIQNDYGQEAIDMLNELPDDFTTIDLNMKRSRGNKNKKEKNRHKKSKT